MGALRGALASGEVNGGAVKAAIDLQRFLEAQEGTYAQALRELQTGKKRSHWMWFMFPQIAGLGLSSTAQRYAIRGRAEAEAYLEHPVLGARLREMTAAVNAIAGGSLEGIFGYPDDLKFHSCVTLFALAAQSVSPEVAVFADALRQWFGGRQDTATLQRLSTEAG
jgi:uncharacterized protein (DUF1810 family)